MTWEDFKKNKEGENFTSTRWEEFKVNREKRKEEKLLQEQEMQNIEQSFIPTLNEDGYLTTGKTYGDYFYNNYGLYKDTPIFAKDNKFYLYSNDKYQELGQLDKKGNVITENIMTTKELEDKELEEAKKLGYKGSKVEGVTSKEYDNAQAAFDKLKKEFKLSDKELEDFKKTGNLSKKHISIQTGSMDKTKEAAENYAKKIRNGEIQQYTYELSPSDKVFLDTNKITGDQRKNYINFLGGKPINISGEKEGTYFKKPNRFEDGWDAGDLTLTLGDTLNLTVANLLGGVGNWIEGGSDTLFNLLGTSLEMAGNTSDKKDVTKDLNGKKVTKYKWGDQIFWFDPENNKLYDDNDTEIPYFNIKNLIKVQEYNDAIADFGRFMKDEVNKSNEMHDFFLNNDITNKFREGSFLGSKSEALIESTGQTLPSIAVSMAGAGPGINAALIFSTTYGQSKAQHIQSGETEEQARMNAFIEASAETISEQFFEGIPGMKTANWGDDLTKALTYGAKEYFGTKAGKIVKKLLPVLGEGFEEIISNSIVAAERTFIGNLFPEYGFNESGLPEGILENMLEQLTTSDSWEQFFGAIITSSILNGGSAIINTRTRNEIIKAYADDNNITFEEAKQELNLFEIGTEFEPADIKLNENDTVSINNVELTEDKIKDIMKRFIIMGETITDEQSLNKLQNAVNQLSDAYEQLQTKKSEKIKEQEKLKEPEKINEPKKEKIIEIKEEQKEPTKDTSQDTQQLTNTIQENEATLEQLKSNQTQNEDQVRKLEQELNALENEKENKDLAKSISKQRAVVEDYQERFTKEQKTFGLTEDTLKIGKQLNDAKTYLQKLIDQQKQQNTNKNDQIAKLKQEIEDLKSKDNTKEIEKLEKQIKEDKNKSEKNTIEEKIEKTESKITIKPNEQNIRSWSQTATEGDYEGVDLVKEISDSLDNTYMPEQNLKNWNKATKKFDNIGYETALKEFKGKIDSNQRITLQDIMMGQKLLVEASKEKKTEDVAYLLTVIPMIGTETGQIAQAMSLIKKLTPEGQLKLLQRTIDRMKSKNIKGMENVKLTNDMIDTILNSETEEDLNKNVDTVKELIAEQMTGTVEDKLRAWRYFAMLGNPKTHIRNIVSNIAMYGTRSLKKLVQKTLEDMVATIAPNAIKERTISWRVTTKEIKKFVDDYIKQHPEKLSNDYKYKVESQIEMLKKAFGKTKAGKILQTVMDFNNVLLENEDLIFKSLSFKMAMREYLTANGMKTISDIENNPNLLENATNYAIEQSLQATFQQYSALAAYINQLGSRKKSIKFALEALLPFKRTPINIAKTGIEYSPIGLLKTVTKNTYDLKKGNITATQFIDNISKGLTGSMLTGLGYILAQAGILRGKADDDDKEAQLEKSLNRQDYSINVGDVSVTIDWLTPASVPLLLGTMIKDNNNENTPLNLNTVTDMVSGISNPLVELSFLQSLDTALDSYNQNKLQGVVETMLSSYISQYVPTFGGQIAKTIDPTVRTTSVSADSPWSFGEQVLRQNINKIPGLTYLLEPSVDIYGNEVRRPDNVILRAMDNMLNPSSIKISKEDEVSSELQELYNRTGEDDVIPTYISKKFTYKKEQYLSNAKEYTQMKKTYGDDLYFGLNNLIKSTEYKTSTDEEKVKLIRKVYKTAKDNAKSEFLKNRGIDY